MSTGQKIGIIGAGESGIGAALLALHVGDEPFVSDYGVVDPVYRQELVENNIRFEESGHTLDILTECDCVVKSPGVPHRVPAIQAIIAAGVEVISEIEYAYRNKPSEAKMIGITGSNGKTTTTNLTHHLLERAGLSVVKGGNLGKSFARLLVDSPADVYVIEISSFQLDDVDQLSVDIAMLLNITPDHLDRYSYDFEQYADSKMSLVRRLKHGAQVIFNAEDDSIVSRLRAAEDVVYHPVSGERLTFGDYACDNVALRGPHNAFNASCAIIAARSLGATDEAIASALADFINDPHRLQSLGEVDGVEWINDSKATNVDSTYHALRAMRRPTVWIVGGKDKGNDYSVLMPSVTEHVKSIIALCEDDSKILSAFRESGIEIVSTKSMNEAVLAAQRVAVGGDVVLLSPACASFDLFKNYQDRGDQFIAEVRSLSS